MKKSLMFLLCFSFPYFLLAQESNKQKEIGLVFSSFDSFGLTYKTGTAKSLWRFNTLFINGSKTDKSSDLLDETQNAMGFGIKFGREFRKVVAGNLELRYGADISFSYAMSKNKHDDKTEADNDIINNQTTYRPGINLMFGLNYVLKDKLVIGAEIMPGITYTTGTS